MSKQTIYKKLLAEIGNPYGVCGLMGNMQAESGLNSKNMQNSYEAKTGFNDDTYTLAVDCGAYIEFTADRIGYGLCQWTSSGRKTGLLNKARIMDVSIGNEDMQVEYLLDELRGSYKGVLAVLKSAKTVKEASDYVLTKFERPADQSDAVKIRRQGLGEVLYNELAKEGDKVLKIAIDAGHGLYTSGKRCLKSIDPNETREWTLNSRIADKLGALLKSYECEVLRVDDVTGQRDVSLADRVAAANNWRANVYISIHHNAGVNGGSGGGTICYYYSSKPERVNQCKDLYEAVVACTGLIGNRATHYKKYGYYVLKNTKMASFLIENGFMDSTVDTPIILTEDHANKTAQGLLNFLVKDFSLKAIEGAVKPSEDAFKVKVVCESLNVRGGAGTSYNVVTTVKRGEVYTIVETSGNWGKLKSGAGWISLSEKYVTRV